MWMNSLLYQIVIATHGLGYGDCDLHSLLIHYGVNSPTSGYTLVEIPISGPGIYKITVSESTLSYSTHISLSPKLRQTLKILNSVAYRCLGYAVGKQVIPVCCSPSSIQSNSEF